jgi:hypothetical protein
MKKKISKTLLAIACTNLIIQSASAQPISQSAKAEVSIKASKDLITARVVARKEAEIEAIKFALRQKLNLTISGPEAASKIQELVKSLSSNLKTTYSTEGDLLTATTTLSIEGSELTDLSRSLGLQNLTAMKAASILFMIDEYYGIATNLDPSKPLVSEVEFFADRSSSASGSNFSDTSSKAASSQSLQGSVQSSSRESSSIAARDRASVSSQSSSSVAGRDRVAIAGQSESAVAARDRGAIAGQGSYGSVAGSRDTSVAAAERNQFAGSRDTSVAAAQRNQMAASRDSSVAAASSSDSRLSASVNSASASSSDNKNVQASSFAKDQKDVVSFKSKTVFPDVNNAKPDQSSFIMARLAQVTSQYGIQFTDERDIRQTGKGKMLISDIETQAKWQMYTDLAGKAPYNANYVVFGKAAMNAEGKSSSGRTICSGQLELRSFNISTGGGLIAGTVVKRAEGSNDQDCRSSLSQALATELAQTVGNAATREVQLLAQLGQVYTVTIYSGSGISRRLGGGFEDELRKLVQDLQEQSRNDSKRAYLMQWKGGDLQRQIERVLDKLGPDMQKAEVESKGTRIFVCVEGRCPRDLN